ncbi:hypothetical protein BH23BAC2_BH23BAC2_05820 [soil metagenome]
MQPNQISETTAHKTIKKWAEERDGKPALLKDNNESGRAGDLLKVVFPGEEMEDLDLLSWEQFFVIFEENNLKFLYIDEEDKEFYRLATRNDI